MEPRPRYECSDCGTKFFAYPADGKCRLRAADGRRCCAGYLAEALRNTSYQQNFQRNRSRSPIRHQHFQENSYREREIPAGRYGSDSRLRDRGYREAYSNAPTTGYEDRWQTARSWVPDSRAYAVERNLSTSGVDSWNLNQNRIELDEYENHPRFRGAMHHRDNVNSPTARHSRTTSFWTPDGRAYTVGGNQFVSRVDTRNSYHDSIEPPRYDHGPNLDRRGYAMDHGHAMNYGGSFSGPTQRHEDRPPLRDMMNRGMNFNRPTSGYENPPQTVPFGTPDGRAYTVGRNPSTFREDPRDLYHDSFEPRRYDHGPSLDQLGHAMNYRGDFNGSTQQHEDGSRLRDMMNHGVNFNRPFTRYETPSRTNPFRGPDGRAHIVRRTPSAPIAGPWNSDWSNTAFDERRASNTGHVPRRVNPRPTDRVPVHGNGRRRGRRGARGYRGRGRASGS